MVQNLIIRGGADMSGITRELRRTQQQMSGFQNSINRSMSGVSTAIKLGLGYISIRAITGFVKATTSIASDLTEVQNVVDVVFGSMAGDINEFAKVSISKFGLSELSAKKYSSTMGAMLKSSGIAGTGVRDMSLDLTKLSADMASFYNIDNDAAFQKIMSGMSGMTMPLKELGINMNIANLEAFAMSKGMSKSYQKMSQAEQTMLRYNYLLSVTGDAQGDFARNTHTWANQTKVLSQQWEILKGSIGAGFINMLMPVVQGFNILIKKIQVAAEYFKAFTALLFGDSNGGGSGGGAVVSGMADSLEDAEEGFGDVGKTGKKAGKDLKGALAGFDEINNLADKASDGAGGLDDVLGGVGSIDLGKASTGELDIDTSKIMDKLKPFIDNMKTLFEPLKDINFDNIKNALDKVRVAAEPLTQAIFSGLHWAVTKIFIPLTTITIENIIPAFLETLAIAMKALNVVLENIKPIIIGIAGAFALWKAIEFANYILYIGALTNTTGFVALFNALKQVTFIGFAGFKTALTGIIEPLKIMAINLLGAVKNAGLLLIELLKQTATLIINAAQWVWQKVVLVASTVAQVAMTAATAAWNVIALIATTVTTALGAAIAFLTSPIGLVILTVAALIAGIVLLVKNWDTVKIAGSKAWEGIKESWSKASEWFDKTIIEPISKGFKGLFNSIISGMNWVIRGLNKISIDIPEWVPGFGGKTFGINISEIPHLAKGGITNGPMMAVIGDNPGGREVVSPLDDLMGMIASAVGSAMMVGTNASYQPIELKVYLDSREVAREIYDPLEKEKGRRGTPVIQGI